LSEDFIPGELTYYAHILDPDFTMLELIPISDGHYGNHLFSKKHFLRTRDYIKEKPNRRAVLNGDLTESTIKSSKGDIYKQVGTVQDQWEWVTEQLDPIAPQILGATSGNHEDRIYNEAGIDVTKEISKALKIPYRNEGMLLKISFGNKNSGVEGRPYTYWVYMTHGYGGARTNAAKTIKAERTSTYIHADGYILSHDHVSNAAPVIYLMPDNRTTEDKETGFRTGSIRATRKLLVKSNAYVKWGGYAEKSGYSPSDLTTPVIFMHGTGDPMMRALI
jgi:hypothetical protein